MQTLSVVALLTVVVAQMTCASILDDPYKGPIGTRAEMEKRLFRRVKELDMLKRIAAATKGTTCDGLEFDLLSVSMCNHVMDGDLCDVAGYTEGCCHTCKPEAANVAACNDVEANILDCNVVKDNGLCYLAIFTEACCKSCEEHGNNDNQGEDEQERDLKRELIELLGRIKN